MGVNDQLILNLRPMLKLAPRLIPIIMVTNTHGLLLTDTESPAPVTDAEARGQLKQVFMDLDTMDLDIMVLDIMVLPFMELVSLDILAQPPLSLPGAPKV